MESRMSSVKHNALIASMMLSLLTAGSLHAADARPATAAMATRVALDLRLPDLTEIYSAEEIARLLGRPLNEDIEEVRVVGDRPEAVPITPTPSIPSGLGAVFWAATNPLQAWRIFMPLAPDQAIPASVSLDTVAYLPPAALAHRDPVMFP